MTLRERVRAYLESLQDRLCRELEAAAGDQRFHEDRWDYAGGTGGGRTRVIGGDGLFEKGGVSLSQVQGRLAARLATRLGVSPQPFYATGVSLVLHPNSPRVPTVHMNVRYLELPDETGPQRAWFGGGADLTPYYLEPDDATHFHRVWKQACDRHDPQHYPRFKAECDRYFRLTHRDEGRGIGGIFFDYLRDDLERHFAFVRDVGDAFTEAYLPIVQRRRDEPWGEAQRRWQLIRRGRYVEFNLVHDRGTLFGLETGGRTESILMSLPPLVAWEYGHLPPQGSPEAALLQVLREPRDWA